MTAIVNRTANVLGRGTSAHYYVYRNGCIIQMVREANVAFHAGSPAFNRDSIGIEHADVCNDPAPYTTQLYERSAELVRDIARRNGFNISVYGIHTNNVNHATVVAHVDVGGHGDPGPYWDWEYYALLLAWDGRTASQRPIRLVSMAVEQAATPPGWQVRRRRRIANDRCANRNDPYGARYWRARPSSTGSPAEFRLIVNQPGLYKVSLWWPNVRGANPETQVQVEVRKAGGPAMANVLINQRGGYGRWNDIGSPFTVPATGAEVIVRVRRTSRKRGWLLADAVRVLKIG
jgi:hypothetical protein